MVSWATKEPRSKKGFIDYGVGLWNYAFGNQGTRYTTPN